MENVDPALTSVVMPCHIAAPYMGAAIPPRLQQADWHARDTRYILAGVLPAPAFDSMIRLVERSAHDGTH